MTVARILSLVFATAMIAGCAGSGGLVPGGGSGAADAVRKHRTGRVVLRIKIPKKSHPRPHRKRGRYIGATTQGMTVLVKDGNNATVLGETVSLTPTSGGCNSALASTVCQFSYALAPGSYHLTLATYDAVTGCPSSCTIPGTANELSTAQAVPFTVVAGQANTVPLSLSAIPVSLVVLPADGSTYDDPSHGFELFGLAAHKIYVEALDADGNFIFGAGAPAFTVSTGSGALNVTLGQPSTASPNAFTITPPATYSGATRVVNVSAAFPSGTDGCAQSGAVCSTTVTVGMQQLVATNSYALTFVYRVGESTPFATISAGVNNSNAIAFDSSANLYVATCAAGCATGVSPDTVSIFAPPYNGQPTVMTKGIADPTSLAFTPAGKLLVGNCASCSLGGTDSIAMFSPPFTANSAPVATNSSGIAHPTALAFDSNGNLFVANCPTGCTGSGAGGTVTEYASPYTGTPSNTLGNGVLSSPVSLAFDSSNNLYVANVNSLNYGGGFVELFAPAPSYIVATSITSAADTTGFCTPTWVSPDISGTSIMVADECNSQVYECSGVTNNQCTSGATISTGMNAPTSVLEDATGVLYVASNGNAKVTTYTATTFAASTTLSTSSNAPFALATLP